MLKVFKPVVQAQATNRNSLSAQVGIELAIVTRPGHSIYIEWPESEPMENVLSVIHTCERAATGEWRAVFDMSDDDMLEVLVGGYRLHGMFVGDLV